MKIHKGDTVKILTGKDKGKFGKVIRIDLRKRKATVEGLNIYKKHVRPRRQGEKGQIIEVVRPMHISNIGLVCSSCGKSFRVAYHFEDGRKVRFCKKCQTVL